MGNCFSCNKKMISVLNYGSKKDILKNGYLPPSEMSDRDKLCKSCLLEIKNNQTHDKHLRKKVSMG